MNIPGEQGNSRWAPKPGTQASSKATLCAGGQKQNQIRTEAEAPTPHIRALPPLTSVLVGVGVRSGGASVGRGLTGSGALSRGLVPKLCSTEALSSFITGKGGNTAGSALPVPFLQALHKHGCKNQLPALKIGQQLP